MSDVREQPVHCVVNCKMHLQHFSSLYSDPREAQKLLGGGEGALACPSAV